MLINLKIKQASKRKLVLDSTPIDISLNPGIHVLSSIITRIVEQQVKAYNSKEIEKPCVDFLTEEQINNKAATGKVAFGTIYNKDKADIKKAIKNALQAFEDGLYAVVIDKKVYDRLDDKVELEKGSEFIFIKLTLLKG